MYRPTTALRTGGSANTNVKWIMGDHLGSTSVTANYAGTLISRTLYKPLHSIQGRLWGEVRYQSGALPTQYTYTEQYSHTADFGLMDYVARWYDPVLGRFAQADSLVPGAGQPRAWDRYSYSVNNPLRYIDPTGHSIDCSPNDYQCQVEVAEENGDDKFPIDDSLGSNMEETNDDADLGEEVEEQPVFLELSELSSGQRVSTCIFVCPTFLLLDYIAFEITKDVGVALVLDPEPVSKAALVLLEAEIIAFDIVLAGAHVYYAHWVRTGEGINTLEDLQNWSPAP